MQEIGAVRQFGPNDVWHVIVYHEIYFWHVNTSCKHVCGDQAFNHFISEVVNDLVSDLYVHVTD